LPEIAARPVTGSAFTQARYKVKPELFSDLLQLLDDVHTISEKKQWKGHFLLAGDGSTLNLPSCSDIEAYFGIHATTQFGVKRYLARTLMIYDVMNDFVIDGQLSTMDKGEKTLLRNSLHKIGNNDILILDRGFGHFCTIKELMSENKKLCIRLPADNSNFAKSVLADEREDFVTTWHPSPKEIENSRKNKLDAALIQVRVTKIRLSTGELELLVTNLYDQQKYTVQDMKDLYKMRWGVEEGFKNLKPKMKIEQFGCKKPAGIFQEFYAHIFCMNMVSLAGNVASEIIETKTSHRKWHYKYNWKNAYRYVREKIWKFLFGHSIDKLLDQLIEQIASSIVPIKPGRHFARDVRASNRKGRITQYNK